MILQEKILLVRERLREALERFGPGTTVGWTGGKDSTVVLALWRELLVETGCSPKLRALNLDTGCKFPEVLAFRDRLAREWGVDVVVVRPGIDLERYPLAVDPVSCCGDLKIRPLSEAVSRLGIPALLTGVRADENPDRADRPWLEDHGDHVRVLPILEWTELDVWTFHVREGIPWCELYDQGYRSLGCVPCTSRSGRGERSGRDAAKEERMGQLRSLGYF
jgi:phosphoadenosine phosphosulfate reductase